MRIGRVNRKKLLAALTATLGTAITLTAITPGVASAQAGSRLCGFSWKSVKSGEMVTRIYEVPVNAICDRATRSGVAALSSPFANRLRDKDIGNWGAHASHRWVTCEAWRSRAADLGGLAGRDLNFIGDNWPKQHNQADICKNMNRSDTAFEMESYWLYDDNDPATPTVDFQRG